MNAVSTIVIYLQCLILLIPQLFFSVYNFLNALRNNTSFLITVAFNVVMSTEQFISCYIVISSATSCFFWVFFKNIIIKKHTHK